MNSYYHLKTGKITQKFFKPDNQNESIIFEDVSVKCPTENQYSSDKGQISISAVCFDCQSLMEYEEKMKVLTCKGNPVFIENVTSIKDYLELVELTIT